ncbi:type II toxin-antitoxin system Phd/YefM family antitoxin [Prosthecomicrobium pneumaticum]|uniref:Antitoxin n=1 Tax=Prosthecomicrobium pneumaticum TaxID=81895 RepID=A0A7W9L343_9HYPH|nr:type II toxin-antitoxin system Phd/YefM family antitoxin [Prosthecomicrobium pneumaticum]MBB5754148.1 prevent-host-death family protein [Prosthecomicrobium pneumaticum]
MSVTMSSRAFNQNVSQARKAAKDGPVIITDRGRPSHVLMTIEEYRRITERPMSLAEALAHPESADIDFDPPRLERKLFHAVDFE